MVRNFASRPPARNSMNVFDRKTKFRQKYLASCDPDSQTYDYVKEEFGRRLVDRVFDVKRFVTSFLSMFSRELY